MCVYVKAQMLENSIFFLFFNTISENFELINYFYLFFQGFVQLLVNSIVKNVKHKSILKITFLNVKWTAEHEFLHDFVISLMLDHAKPFSEACPYMGFLPIYGPRNLEPLGIVRYNVRIVRFHGTRWRVPPPPPLRMVPHGDFLHLFYGSFH